MNKPEFLQVREFAILEYSQINFFSEDLRFVCCEEDFPHPKSIEKKLDELGFIDDVAPGKTPICRMREGLLGALGELQRDIRSVQYENGWVGVLPIETGSPQELIEIDSWSLFA